MNLEDLQGKKSYIIAVAAAMYASGGDVKNQISSNIKAARGVIHKI